MVVKVVGIGVIPTIQQLPGGHNIDKRLHTKPVRQLVFDCVKERNGVCRGRHTDPIKPVRATQTGVVVVDVRVETRLNIGLA